MSSPSENDLKRYHFSTIVNFYYDLNEIKEIYNCQVWNRKDILGTARNSLEEHQKYILRFIEEGIASRKHPPSARQLLGNIEVVDSSFWDSESEEGKQDKPHLDFRGLLKNNMSQVCRTPTQQGVRCSTSQKHITCEVKFLIKYT